MKMSKNSELGNLKIWSKSKEGAWAMACLSEDGIDINWQPRTRRIGTSVVSLDINGDVFEASTVDKHNPLGVIKAGTIPVGDEFVSMCGSDMFNSFLSSIAMHAVNMVTLGYGDTVEEIVELFSCLRPFNFANGVSYVFCDTDAYLDNEDNQFSGLVGTRATVSVNGNVCTAIIEMGDGVHEVPLKDDKSKVDFILNTRPV